MAIGAFVLAWIVAALMASWLFGSGNILVSVIAGFAGVTTYLASGAVVDDSREPRENP